MNRSWFHSFLYECPVVHCSSTCPTFPQQFSPYPLCHLCYTSRVYISVDLFLYCLFCSIHLFLYHYINILKSYLLLLFSRSVVSDSLWPWTAARQASLSFTCFPEFAQTHVLWVSDAIQPSHALSPLFLLPSIFPSIRIFSNESAPYIRRPASASEVQLQHQSTQWIFRTDFL